MIPMIPNITGGKYKKRNTRESIPIVRVVLANEFISMYQKDYVVCQSDEIAKHLEEILKKFAREI